MSWDVRNHALRVDLKPTATTSLDCRLRTAIIRERTWRIGRSAATASGCPLWSLLTSCAGSGLSPSGRARPDCLPQTYPDFLPPAGEVPGAAGIYSIDADRRPHVRASQPRPIDR
jgi:hypothetical protein